MHTDPQPQHHWLKKLLGKWTYEHHSQMQPDQPPERLVGTETVRPLGDLWVLCELEGEMPGGGSCNTLITLGFDPAKGKVVGSFVGSMMAMQWLYEGELNPAGEILHLTSEGPSFSGDGGTSKYRDTIEFLNPDERTFTSAVLESDGTWKSFMTSTYRRVS